MTLQTAPSRLFLWQGGNSHSTSVGKVFSRNKPCNYKALWSMVSLHNNNEPLRLTNLWCGESELYDIVHNSQTWIPKRGQYQYFWSSQTLVAVDVRTKWKSKKCFTNPNNFSENRNWTQILVTGSIYKHLPILCSIWW